MKKYIPLFVLIALFCGALPTYAATITSFTASDPAAGSQAVDLAWRTSGAANVSIDVICPSNAYGLSFYIKEGGSRPSCDKGGVASFTNQTNNVVTIQPQNNTRSVTVDFVLTILNSNGNPTGETETVTVTFAASKTTILSFTATTPNSVGGASQLSWYTSAPTDASIDYVCAVGSIQFYSKEDNRTFGCEKGGLVSYQSQSHNVIGVTPIGNTKAISVPFTLKLFKDGYFTGEARTVTVTFPAQAERPLVSSALSCENGAVYNPENGKLCSAASAIVRPTVCKAGERYSSENGKPCPMTAAASADIDPEPSASACLSLAQDLRYRSIGTAVSGLQDYLQASGYLNSEPTGYFGLLTLQAVKNFQSSQNISPTGFVGPLTRAKIKALTCS